MALPTRELLESRHQFPCRYTFKAIGPAVGSFSARVIAEVRQELNLDQDPPFQLKESRGGRHVSVTAEPTCESAQQVIAVYARLTGLEELVMLL